MTTVYCDEWGFTGDDLLNRDQPTFGICSTTLTDEEAEEILRTAFPSYQGDEFKATQVWRRRSTRSRMSQFTEELEPYLSRVFLFEIDKSFTLTVKLLDTFVEPAINRAGRSFYSAAGGLNLANQLHFFLQAQGPRDCQRAIHEAVSRFGRAPSFENASSLAARMTIIANASEQPLRGLLLDTAAHVQSFADHEDLTHLEGSFDVYVSAVLETVRHWARQAGGRIELVHDESAHLLRRLEVWDPLRRPDDLGRPVTNYVGLTTTQRAPIEQRRPVDSKESRAVQLCDVIGGLAARSRKPHALTPEELTLVFESPFGRLTANRVGPERERLTMPVEFPIKHEPDALDIITEAITADVTKDHATIDKLYEDFERRRD